MLDVDSSFVKEYPEPRFLLAVMFEKASHLETDTWFLKQFLSAALLVGGCAPNFLWCSHCCVQCLDCVIMMDKASHFRNRLLRENIHAF